MKSFILMLLVVLTVMSAAGCRQSDGPMPAVEGDVPNQLGDMTRDLLAIGRNEAEARQDFADDLKVFARGRKPGEQAADALAQRIAAAVSGRSLNEQAAQQLAHTTWTVVAATELSERQVQQVQTELKTQLAEAGVPDAQASEVAASVPEVQKTVSTRPRRWYEML